MTEVDVLKFHRMVQRTHLQGARASGDRDQASRHEQVLRDIEAQITEKEATMGYEASRDEIVAEFRKKVGGALVELANLNARAETLPADYVERERQRITREVEYLDSRSRNDIRSWATVATEYAAKLRAKADAERNPQERLADELLLQRLTAGVKVRRQADDLLVEARRLASLGQPQRAKIYVDAARAHGAFGADQVASELESALDDSVPDRRRARALERTVDTSVREFEVYRRLTLAEGGIGVREDGSAGRGRLPDIARATGSAKDMLHRLDAEAAS